MIGLAVLVAVLLWLFRTLQLDSIEGKLITISERIEKLNKE